MACERFKALSNDRLSAAGRARFERHLEGCLDCRRQVDKLQILEREFSTMARGGEQRQPAWNAGTRYRLVTYAARRRPQSALSLSLPSLAAAAALFILAIAGVLYFTGRTLPSRDGGHPQVAARVFNKSGDVEAAGYKGVEGEVLESPDDGRLLVNVSRDTIGLNRRSRVKIGRLSEKETRLLLVRGQVACRVAKRRQGSRFVVETKDRQIVVTGTRFSVKTDNRGLAVTVTEGSVEVKGAGGTRLPVKSGETLLVAEGREPLRTAEKGEQRNTLNWLLGQSRRWKESCYDSGDCAQDEVEEKPPSPNGASEEKKSEPRARQKPRRTPAPSLTHWREMILSGRLQEAETGLLEHVRANPRDVEGWWLLSTCRRKSGKWVSAVNAYRKVIEYGDPGRADKARFRAAVILQEQLGRHQQAISLLTQYIENGARNRPLRAEAMVRLAESLLAIGQKTKAARILEETTQQYGQTPASDRARQILERVR